MKTELKHFLFGAGAMAVIAFALYILTKQPETAQISQSSTETVTYSTRDTNRVKTPVLGANREVQTLWIKIPVQDPKLIRERDSLLALLGIVMHDRDSLLELTVTQREYQDSTYHAWVSGIRPRLDSIYVYPRNFYRQTTNTEYQYIEKKPKFTMAFQGGFGCLYGVKNGFDVGGYMGIGVGLNIYF